ncbi:MAG: DNA topoisomerase VI subunit B, partial [Candidatus Micrarchaeia archaeon]
MADKQNIESSAQTIFKEFREHSVAEFFKKNRQMLGLYGKVRSLTTVIHEYVTNSLDAAEEAGVLPDITIEIKALPNDHYLVKVADNSTGIPKQHVGRALGMMLAGTKFHRYMQQRGQQGIGASGCTMFAQITTGKPVHVKTGVGDGKIYECDVSIDVKTNKPHITNEKEYMGNLRGVEITAEFGEVKYEKSEYGVFEYLKRTALVNPHAQITLIEPDGQKIVFPRSTTYVPKPPREIQPHPLGVTTHDLMDMTRHTQARKLSSFFTQTFARFSSTKVRELQDRVQHINLNKRPDELTWAEAEDIVRVLKEMKWIAPEMDSLRPIGGKYLENAVRNILDAEFLAIVERKPRVFRGGVPFMVEVAIAYGGNAGRVTATGVSGEIMRFANKVPLLFDSGGCAITEAVKTIEWKRYGIKDFENEPITVIVSFVSVYVPYTGAGKQAVSGEEEIVTEIRYAVMECARKLQRY